jgi:acyl-CoA thioesterase FadM
VNMLLRTLLQMWKSRRAKRLSMLSVSRIRLRVVPSDLDVLGHMNNGVYLSYMDLGRMDLTIRAGAWDLFTKRGWLPVAASETMSFRRSLKLWQSFELQTRIVGYDERAVFMQQRFVVDGDIYAEGIVRGRFAKTSGGTVTMVELGEVLGIDPNGFRPAVWVEDWAKSSAMPASKAIYRSDWF